MSGVTDTETTVAEVVQGFRFARTATSISGTRVFVEPFEGADTQALPNLGDPWDTEYPEVTAKEIIMGYLENNPACPKTWTVNYDGSPWVYSSEALDANELLVNIDTSGEFKIWSYLAGTMFWASDSSQIKNGEQFNRHIALQTIKVNRVIKDIEAWNSTCLLHTNTLNNGSFFGFSAGMVKFAGARTQQYTDMFGHKSWKAELIFDVKNVNNVGGGGENGWNYVWRKDTMSFDRPRTETGKYLYDSSDFDSMFDSADQDLGSDYELNADWPDS